MVHSSEKVPEPLLYASMMIHIARTSCNRQMYLLVQAPTYGYSYNQAVKLANNQAGSFLNHSSCTCFGRVGD